MKLTIEILGSIEKTNWYLLVTFGYLEHSGAGLD